MGLVLGASTYEYLTSRSLDDALDRITRLGFRYVELMAYPPHIDAATWGEDQTRRLVRTIRDAGLTVTSLGPTYVDLNLSSLDPGIRAASIESVRHRIQLASAFGSLVFVAAGRRGGLQPASVDVATRLLEDSVQSLATEASRHGVDLVLEPVPYALLPTMGQIYDFMERLSLPHVRSMIDVANLNLVEPPVEAIRNARHPPLIVHLSDNDGVTFSHDEIGSGGIDFSAVADALRATGYEGVSIMETVTPDPDASMIRSRDRLLDVGWTT